MSFLILWLIRPWKLSVLLLIRIGRCKLRFDEVSIHLSKELPSIAAVPSILLQQVRRAEIRFCCILRTTGCVTSASKATPTPMNLPLDHSTHLLDRLYNNCKAEIYMVSSPLWQKSRELIRPEITAKQNQSFQDVGLAKINTAKHSPISTGTAKRLATKSWALREVQHLDWKKLVGYAPTKSFLAVALEVGVSSTSCEIFLQAELGIFCFTKRICDFLCMPTLIMNSSFR